MKTSGWRSSWVSQKRDLALRLGNGEAGAGYAESAILICSVLSALSAEVWPGRSIDRVRFIELLVSLGSDAEVCRLISVPLLVRYLKQVGNLKDAETLMRTFGLPSSARVLTGPEIDRSESDVRDACPSLESVDIRRWSYASLLYGQVRTAYAHEYRPGEVADAWPMTMMPNQHVSYINRLMETENTRMERLIHFHFEWLGNLALERAAALDRELVVPRVAPIKWWADGG